MNAWTNAKNKNERRKKLVFLEYVDWGWMGMKSRNSWKLHLRSLFTIHAEFQHSSSIRVRGGGETSIFRGQKGGKPLHPSS